MKSLSHLKHYQISKEKLKLTRGSNASIAGNACSETCEGTCEHFSQGAPEVEACIRDCKIFC